jgi:hypothetical protein
MVLRHAHTTIPTTDETSMIATYLTTNRRAAVACLFISVATVWAADPPAPAPPPGRVMLPQQHAYQRVLRAYMAGLTEQDFEHGVTTELAARPSATDPDYQYRMLIMTMTQQPLVGWKRGTPAVNAPAWLFLLSTIEGPEVAPPVKPLPVPKKPTRKITPGPIQQPAGIVVPPVWPETLVSFVQWDYPGNPFRDNRALKLRAFVTAAVKMMMLDDYLEKMPIHHRTDWNAYRLVSFSSTYAGVADILPDAVAAAYRTGVLKLAKQMLSWGVKGEETGMDANGPLGLLYASRVCDDAAFTNAAEAEARDWLTNPARLNPAGYWVERGGGLDVGFGGIANFYAVWVALMTDWEVARDAVARIYRLRAHLCLPDPDGTLEGPSHFNSRIGSPASDDQWHWNGARERAAAMLTDEAAYLVSLPAAEDLAGAAAKRAGMFRAQLYGNLRNPYHRNKKFGYVPDNEIRGRTWKWRIWDSGNFPASINPGAAFYQTGTYARLQQLHAGRSPYLKSPYLRDTSFLQPLSDAFVVTRQPKYAAILHTGPVGAQPRDDGLVQYPGPLGFGGGQLSAFWTPATGSVLLGRRRGMNFDKSFDELDQWRLWPLHAISGATADGKVLTSGRVVRPESTSQLKEVGHGTVRVSGVFPATMLGQDNVLVGRLAYARTFTITPDGVHIGTTVSGDGKDAFAELVESLPVFVKGGKRQKAVKPTQIQFRIGGEWHAAESSWADAVTAVRLRRFTGAVDVTFDSPQRVQLSAEDWVDTYLTKVKCRNVLIDLLGDSAGPVTVTQKRSVSYRIAAAAE